MEYNCPKKGIKIVQKMDYKGITIVQKGKYNCPKMELQLPTPQRLIGSDSKILTHLQSTITEVNCNWSAADEKLPYTKLEKVQIKDMFAKTFT